MKQLTIGDRSYIYDEQDELGRGAFGSVYKGRIKDLNEIIAVKTMDRANFEKKYGQDLINQIGDEVNILQRLSFQFNTDPCPFIVRIYDCFEANKMIYVIMQYCDGGNLLDIMKAKKQLTQKEANFYYFQIMSAINYIHQRGIGHRDIKPENIFFRNGYCKLGDFGFATNQKMCQTSVGTPPYMGPEFYTSDSYGLSVDIWSMGIMYHEMIFGELYFKGTSNYILSQNVINTPYVIQNPSAVSQDGQKLLTQSLIKDPNTRITAQEILAIPSMAEIGKSSEIAEIYKIQVERDLKFKSRNAPTNPAINEQMLQSKKKLEFVLDALMNARNGVFFSIQLVELLQNQYLEISRFDVFYIIKNSLIFLIELKEQLMQNQLPEELKFIPEADWQAFLTNRAAEKFKALLANDIGEIYQYFFSYHQALDNYITQNYPFQKDVLKFLVNTNIQTPIPEDLYRDQLQKLGQYFLKQYQSAVRVNQELAKQFLSICFKITVTQEFRTFLPQQKFSFEEFEKTKNTHTIEYLYTLLNTVL